jgi:hypothetical protein
VCSNDGIAAVSPVGLIAWAIGCGIHGATTIDATALYPHGRSGFSFALRHLGAGSDIGARFVGRRLYWDQGSATVR